MDEAERGLPEQFVRRMAQQLHDRRRNISENAIDTVYGDDIADIVREQSIMFFASRDRCGCQMLRRDVLKNAKYGCSFTQMVERALGFGECVPDGAVGSPDPQLKLVTFASFLARVTNWLNVARSSS